MRIYLHLTPNTEPVPFDYQQNLVGAFHKWLGENELHDDISLYSLSWLAHGHRRGQSLDFPGGSIFQISSPSDDLLASLLQGVVAGHQIAWGMEVYEITIQRTPTFGSKRRFLVQSPVLTKKKRENAKHHQYYYPGDPEADSIMTHIMRRKLEKAGLNTDVEVVFDKQYKKVDIRKITYKGIDIKASICPVIVSGDPAAVQFAWEVGVGNSTGIGFGALK